MNVMRGPTFVWRLDRDFDAFEFRWYGGQGVGVFQVEFTDRDYNNETVREIDYFTIGQSLWELPNIDERIKVVDDNVRWRAAELLAEL